MYGAVETPDMVFDIDSLDREGHIYSDMDRGRPKPDSLNADTAVHTDPSLPEESGDWD